MFFNEFTTKASLKCTEHICTFSLADAQRPDNIFAAQQIMPRYIKVENELFHLCYPTWSWVLEGTT